MLTPLAVKIGTAINIQPDPGGLPGGTTMGRLVNGLAFYTLLAAAAGLLISGMAWAFGSHSGNYNATSRGKVGVAVAALVAGLAGASSAIVNFFFAVGGTVH